MSFRSHTFQALTPRHSFTEQTVTTKTFLVCPALAHACIIPEVSFKSSEGFHGRFSINEPVLDDLFILEITSQSSFRLP